MSAVLSSSLRRSPGLTAANAPSVVPLTGLLYQSEASNPISEIELQKIIDSAQSRNSVESITGLLIYDEGRFLQWLEGPADSLQRVWQSICSDSRHQNVQLIGEYPARVRMFGKFHMALGRRHLDGWWSGKSEINLPPNVINILRGSPSAAPLRLAQMVAASFAQAPSAPARGTMLAQSKGLSLKAVVRNVIVTKLLSRHAEDLPRVSVVDPKARVLAKLLLAVDSREYVAFIDSLRCDGRSLAELCAGLLEPAARALGELWQSDDCSEFDVTMALGRLQSALHRSSFEDPFVTVPQLSPSMPHSILVAPSPQETHVLGSAIASEMFWRAGWEVSCEFPDSDAALGKLLRERWFDVLDLSLSSTFTREHRLPAMAASIRAAHAQSLNPGLTVIVDGRVFHERPLAFVEVGADASSASALGLVSVAQRRRPAAQ